MKRLFVILLVLCPLVSSSILWAQIYSTSSATYRSFSTGGTATHPVAAEFRSTSVYTKNPHRTPVYSTAPMKVANGAIVTVASNLQGDIVTEPAISGYIPTRPPKRVPYVPDEPLSDGWDVAILLALLCAGYALYLKHKNQKAEIKTDL